jgi:hypothetical protein
MQKAAEKAQDLYACPGFERIVYLGDGSWDLKEAHVLGYEFIGIGPRVKSLIDSAKGNWHRDFREIEAVLASVAAALKL